MIESLIALWDRLDYRALPVIKCAVAVGATLVLT
jgi:hypothetical protein